jgi:hypothetical protein
MFSVAPIHFMGRYNLGLLTRKSHVVVDIAFARICSDIINRAVLSPPHSLMLPQVESSGSAPYNSMSPGI